MATDPQGARRAAAQVRQAEALARAAQDEAEAAARAEARIRAIEWVNRALRELVAYRAQRAKALRGRPAPADDCIERTYMLALNLAADRWEALQRQERARGTQAQRLPRAVIGKS